MTLEDLKKQHRTLHDRAFAESSILVGDKAKMKSFLAEVDPFLEDLAQLSGEVASVEDYDWISDAALKWQLTLSSVLNIPHRPVTLSASPLLNRKPLKFYTESEVGKWFETTARDQYLGRWRSWLEQPDSEIGKILRSTPEEKAQDWHDTEILFAAKVLEGGFHLARQVGPQSYYRLEDQWFDEVKRAKAYFIWEARHQPKAASPSRHQQDYLKASEQLRSLLVRKDLKARALEFEDIREYLTRRYLTDGKLDPQKLGTTELVGRKAHRIWQTTGERDSTKNWTNALTYCRAFYENILPAVLAEDPESKREHTLLALQALQPGKAGEYRCEIVNCFEVALAIYFLDAGIVEELWAEGALPVASTL